MRRWVTGFESSHSPLESEVARSIIAARTLIRERVGIDLLESHRTCRLTRKRMDEVGLDTLTLPFTAPAARPGTGKENAPTELALQMGTLGTGA